MRAKICGITSLDDALFAVKHGAWALGFNFYKASARYLNYINAQEIIKLLPAFVIKVGVFVDVSDSVIEEALVKLNLDYAQVYTHKNRSKQLMSKMILSLNANEEKDLPNLKVLRLYGAILMDAPLADDFLKGGTGRLANWSLSAKLSKKVRLILAGGLNHMNVKSAITQVKPYAVDVASGVETAGVKDKSKLKAFLETCHAQ